MQFIKNIGRGGFGTVDLVAARDGTQYARKTFSINQPGHFPQELVDNVKRRFTREAGVQAGFSHPNIMPVLAASLDVDPPSFLMPVASASLADDMAMDPQLWGGAITAIMDILAGLEELHSLGITHRDLKPQNVMRFDDGGMPRYVIGDFGLMSIKDTQLSVLTQTGMRMGSDFYTAPEIVADLRRATAASDIYSVGCILHDMFGTDPQRIPCAEITDDQGPYADIIRACTRRLPSRRFATIAGLRDAILSVDHTGSVASEAEIDVFIQALATDHPIPPDTWEQIARRLTQVYPSADATLLLHQMSVSRIEEAIQVNPEAAISLCETYSDWVRKNAFDFNLCDGIANRLEVFLSLNNIHCEAEVRMALLRLGTSHNRWYVERKFVRLCDEHMDLATAKRVAIELRVLGQQACQMIDHLEWSIKIDKNVDLHPVLARTLSQVCS